MFKPVLDQAEGKAGQVMQKGSCMLAGKIKHIMLAELLMHSTLSLASAHPKICRLDLASRVHLQAWGLRAALQPANRQTMPFKQS